MCWRSTPSSGKKHPLKRAASTDDWLHDRDRGPAFTEASRGVREHLIAQDPRQISPLRRHLSPLTHFLAIAILALFVGAEIVAWPVIGKNALASAGRAEPAPSGEARGAFSPTKEQWAGFKIEPVGLLSFRPEQVTEGNIAVDDNLTTPVFSHYSGRFKAKISW